MTADRINDIVTTSQEDTERARSFENRQLQRARGKPAAKSAAAFGGSAAPTTARATSARATSAHRYRKPSTADASPRLDVKDIALEDTGGKGGGSALPLWRRAVERAKFKARLCISVVRAFEENAKVRVSWGLL